MSSNVGDDAAVAERQEYGRRSGFLDRCYEGPPRWILCTMLLLLVCSLIVAVIILAGNGDGNVYSGDISTDKINDYFPSLMDTDGVAVRVGPEKCNSIDCDEDTRCYEHGALRTFYRPDGDLLCFCDGHHWKCGEGGKFCQHEPILPPNAHLPLTCEDIPSGGSCPFTCIGGFVPSGDFICTDGVWDTQQCLCSASELDALLLRSAIFGVTETESCDKTKVGEDCSSWKCGGYLAPADNPLLECSSRGWKTSEELCVCQVNPLYVALSIQDVDYVDATGCSHTGAGRKCDKKYWACPEGQDQMGDFSCDKQTGLWNVPQYPCSCTEYEITIPGFKSGCHYLGVGQSCYYHSWECKDSLIPITELTCTTDGLQGSCGCPSQTLKDNVNISTSASIGDCDKTPIGEECFEWSCGPELEKRCCNSPICQQDGTWLVEPDMCGGSTTCGTFEDNPPGALNVGPGTCSEVPLGEECYLDYLSDLVKKFPCECVAGDNGFEYRCGGPPECTASDLQQLVPFSDGLGACGTALDTTCTNEWSCTGDLIPCGVVTCRMDAGGWEVPKNEMAFCGCDPVLLEVYIPANDCECTKITDQCVVRCPPPFECPSGPCSATCQDDGTWDVPCACDTNTLGDLVPGAIVMDDTKLCFVGEICDSTNYACDGTLQIVDPIRCDPLRGFTGICGCPPIEVKGSDSGTDATAGDMICEGYRVGDTCPPDYCKGDFYPIEPLICSVDGWIFENGVPPDSSDTRLCGCPTGDADAGDMPPDGICDVQSLIEEHGSRCDNTRPSFVVPIGETCDPDSPDSCGFECNGGVYSCDSLMCTDNGWTCGGTCQCVCTCADLCVNKCTKETENHLICVKDASVDCGNSDPADITVVLGDECTMDTYIVGKCRNGECGPDCSCGNLKDNPCGGVTTPGNVCADISGQKCLVDITSSPTVPCPEDFPHLVGECDDQKTCKPKCNPQDICDVVGGPCVPLLQFFSSDPTTCTPGANNNCNLLCDGNGYAYAGGSLSCTAAGCWQCEGSCDCIPCGCDDAPDTCIDGEVLCLLNAAVLCTQMTYMTETACESSGGHVVGKCITSSGATKCVEGCSGSSMCEAITGTCCDDSGLTSVFYETEECCSPSITETSDCYPCDDSSVYAGPDLLECTPGGTWTCPTPGKCRCMKCDCGPGSGLCTGGTAIQALCASADNRECEFRTEIVEDADPCDGESPVGYCRTPGGCRDFACDCSDISNACGVASTGVVCNSLCSTECSPMYRFANLCDDGEEVVGYCASAVACDYCVCTDDLCAGTNSGEAGIVCNTPANGCFLVVRTQVNCGIDEVVVGYCTGDDTCIPWQCDCSVQHVEDECNNLTFGSSGFVCLPDSAKSCNEAYGSLSQTCASGKVVSYCDGTTTTLPPTCSLTP